jgi:NADH-ubiquinone oxidoreductase chain 3
LIRRFILTLILCLIFLNINELVKVNKQKIYEFECGFNILNNNRLSFSTQYFLITIMFLIFDLEIVLIVPIILENLRIIKELFFINFLVIILTLGLFLE